MKRQIENIRMEEERIARDKNRADIKKAKESKKESKKSSDK